ELEDTLENVKNISVRAEEYNDKIVFLHKVEPGRANGSYGIHVAKLAEMPQRLIERADEILHTLENKVTVSSKTEDVQLSLYEEDSQHKRQSNGSSQEQQVIQYTKQLELYDITPMDVMQFLYDTYKARKK